MLILGIETSCDETSASIVENGTKILSNVVASSLPLHAKTGGIIPEVAARQQIKYIIPVIEKAIENCKFKIENLGSIAVTIGPGLIGSLLVGVETAKTLAYVWNKPIIPVNHLIGHIYANWLVANSVLQIEKPRATRHTPHAKIDFPALVLIVSGGHTDLLLMKGHGKLKWLGGTRDDAAGEAFDKIARLLNLPYPGGPSIEKASDKGNPKAFNFPRPMLDSGDFDFSFSGLKTAVLREVQILKQRQQFNNSTIQQLAYDVQEAIIDVLIAKTIRAAQIHKVKSILLSGGVAANEKSRNELKLSATRHRPHAKFFVPEKFLCTDNGAMIASAAYFNYKPVDWRKITANPELYFD